MCRSRLEPLIQLLILTLSTLAIASAQEAATLAPPVEGSGSGSLVSPSSLSSYCPEGSLSTFELITGSVYQSPGDTLTTIPGILKITECLESCQSNVTCRSVNYETGLCILFSSSASSNPGGLQPSQFPVFTIYAQKICLSKESLSRSSCGQRSWAFERVSAYELRKFPARKLSQVTQSQCMEACLSEADFICRSFNYDSASQECILSEQDRHTLAVSSNARSKDNQSLLPSVNGTTDYFESNCVAEPNKLCDFKQTKGKILKTVDSVHQDVTTVEECKKLCLSSPYRCFSFDLGDPTNQPVCRTSHLDKASLSHIEQPYLEIPGSVTYELFSCYNVTILCRAKEMIASVQTSKLFNGKIYAKSKPNSCVNDVSNSLDFDIVMPFHDVMCDVKQVNAGSFANDIVIQHHDMIVTTSDLGLSVHCNYDLSNRSISNVNLEVDGDIEHREGGEAYVHSSVVGAPNVTMSITDRDGAAIQAAQVGDALSLRFEILERSSPYEILVRELVAVDGADSSEILLIDSQGCPTDSSIMGAVSRTNGNGQALEVPFDAFKFPSSDVVQFRALVTPCVPSCEPVVCDIKGYDGKKKEVTSYGRRKRSTVDGNGSTFHSTMPRTRLGPRSSLQHSPARTFSTTTAPPSSSKSPDEEMVVVKTIKIHDSFDFPKGSGRKDSIISKNSRPEIVVEDIELDSTNRVSLSSSLTACNNFWSLMIACSLFLLAQLMLIFAWAMVWLRRQRHRRLTALMAETSSTHSSGCSTYGGQAIPSPSPFGIPTYKGFHPANIAAFASAAHHHAAHKQQHPGFRTLTVRNPE